MSWAILLAALFMYSFIMYSTRCVLWQSGLYEMITGVWRVFQPKKLSHTKVSFYSFRLENNFWTLNNDVFLIGEGGGKGKGKTLVKTWKAYFDHSLDPLLTKLILIFGWDSFLIGMKISLHTCEWQNRLCGMISVQI